MLELANRYCHVGLGHLDPHFTQSTKHSLLHNLFGLCRSGTEQFSQREVRFTVIFASPEQESFSCLNSLAVSVIEENGIGVTIAVMEIALAHSSDRRRFLSLHNHTVLTESYLRDRRICSFWLTRRIKMCTDYERSISTFHNPVA